jgi:cell division protein ZapA
MNETLAPPAAATHEEPFVPVPSVSVEIYDQIYHLRGVDPVYIDYLAAMVDEKMRAVAAQGGTVDSLRVAVLAALNIADELSSLRSQYNSLLGSRLDSESSMQSRAHSLAGMLDEVLEDRRAG